MLELINRIQTKKGNTRYCLYDNFKDSLLWKDIELWLQLFNSLFKKKKQSQKKKNNLFSLINNVQKFITSGPDEEKIKELKDKLKFLDLIAFYLKNLNLNFDLASEIILEISKEHQLPTEHVARVIDRFESDCLLQSVGKMVMEKGKNRGYKWGTALPFRYAMDFLSTTEEKINLCLLNKEMSKKLLPKLHSKVLSKEIQSDTERLKIWSTVLEVVS